VFIVRNLRTGFHPMFVEFTDFVIAVDAPAGYPIMIELPAGDVAPGPAPDWLARRYIELIREAIPSKPIRFVVVTHFHNDHAGGMRAFVAEGATVLTTAADEEAVRAYFAASHEGARDDLSERPAPLHLQVVGDRRVFSDGARTLEVLATGANPHTDDMLIVQLPNDQLVFVSDLMNTLSPDELPTATEDPPLAFFLRWLVQRNLDPARIITMHGAGAVERLDWRRAYDRMREPR
jgi:glyoxylase-like metal-dependent hydrolase (beta-lactamase superfamily II)